MSYLWPGSQRKGRQNCCSCQAQQEELDLKPLIMKRPPPKNWLLRRGGDRPCFQYFCGAVALLSLLGLVQVVVVRFSIEVSCVDNADVQRAMPQPSADLPPMWRGIIWMDQGGFYGYSDLSEGSGSLAMSFGGATVDRYSRTARVSNTGPSWSVENNPSGYWKFFSTAALRYSYLFEFSEDYRFAQIYPSVQPFGGFLGTWYVPKALMSFTMEVQDLSGRSCPPSRGSSKLDISRCAKWDRKTTYFDLIPAISRQIGAFHYPAFEIVNPDGNRGFAFDSYERWADETTSPSSLAAWLLLGIDLRSSGCDRPATSLLGR